MDRVEQLEVFFDQLIANIPENVPDGILQVSISLLKTYKLLSDQPKKGMQAPIAHFLKIIESKDKIILYNDNFVVFILPKNEENATTVFIARSNQESYKVEIAFQAQGIHNNSRTILRLIERLLTDIEETDRVIEQLSN